MEHFLNHKNYPGSAMRKLCNICNFQFLIRLLLSFYENNGLFLTFKWNTKYFVWSNRRSQSYQASKVFFRLYLPWQYLRNYPNSSGGRIEFLFVEDTTCFKIYICNIIVYLNYFCSKLPSQNSVYSTKNPANFHICHVFMCS